MLVATQAACLGLGLWIETRFAQAVAENAVLAVSDAAHVGSHSLPLLRLMSFGWIIALQTAVAYLILSRECSVASHRENLAADKLLRHQNDLIRTRDAVVFGLARLAESRDPETGNHLERIALYSTLLAKAIRRSPRYRDEVSASFVQLIGISSALHDIGKVGVPDSILLKPGKLTDAERDLIQKHAEIGARCVRDIELRLGGSNFLQMARQIALSHHERWDGSGYPKRLAGESIPLAARIVAIADVYDALTVRRVYKEACSHEYSMAMIRDGSGRQFDPGLVDVFLKVHTEFRDIARRCVDPTRCSADASDETDTSSYSTGNTVVISLPQYNQSTDQTLPSHAY